MLEALVKNLGAESMCGENFIEDEGNRTNDPWLSGCGFERAQIESAISRVDE
jgi:hypothetical protein